MTTSRLASLLASIWFDRGAGKKSNPPSSVLRKLVRPAQAFYCSFLEQNRRQKARQRFALEIPLFYRAAIPGVKDFSFRFRGTIDTYRPKHQPSGQNSAFPHLFPPLPFPDILPRRYMTILSVSVVGRGTTLMTSSHQQEDARSPGGE